MAKGQVRSNKEKRKPKKDKLPPKPETGFSSQMKSATLSAAPKPKGKA